MDFLVHQPFSGRIQWFRHFGWKHPLHGTLTLPGQELSSILWSFASFVVAPRADIVSDFCETLVQRTGFWAGRRLEVGRIQSLHPYIL